MLESYAFWLTVIAIIAVVLLIIVILLCNKMRYLFDVVTTNVPSSVADIKLLKEDLQKTKEDLDTRDQLFSDTLKEFSHTIGSEVGKTLLNYEQNNNIRMSGIDNRLKRVETRVGAVFVGVDLAKGPDMSTTSKITACDNPEFDTSDPEYAAAIKPKVIDGGTF